MTMRLGVVMDPIESIHYKKDSTLALLWEAKARGWQINYFEPCDLFLRDGIPFGRARALKVARDPSKWYAFGAEATMPLAELDVILMRKDPPFNEEYIYCTYLLEQAERLGVLVVNRPQSLRDCNEKLFTTWFPQCMPATIVTQSIERLHAFNREHQDIVCKPLNSMGGASVFRLQNNDVNASVVFDTLTRGGTLYTMAQKFIPAITLGDKRILMVNGEPVSHVLARIPQAGDWRGNLAVGAKGVAQVFTERDQYICAQVGPVLRERGLYFVGLDVIGDYLTEINVTSPTCIRELDEQTGSNISALLFDQIEQNIN